MPETPDELTEDERRQLRRAGERLRTASKELESLVATDPIKNRWAPEPAPPEILEAARSELGTAWSELVRSYRELLGWEPPAPA
ncbi:MAG: hypothetical protein QOI64_2841 [Solirubrobacteraceae bacterium]|jgi:hypothetical protein|nr:hypothetical protein [Solirubrobacteraceae bacterium]